MGTRLNVYLKTCAITVLGLYSLWELLVSPFWKVVIPFPSTLLSTIESVKVSIAVSEMLQFGLMDAFAVSKLVLTLVFDKIPSDEP